MSRKLGFTSAALGVLMTAMVIVSPVTSASYVDTGPPVLQLS